MTEWCFPCEPAHGPQGFMNPVESFQVVQGVEEDQRLFRMHRSR